MREFVLIVALLVTLTAVNIIYYSKAKRELNYQVKKSYKLLKLAKDIEAVKSVFKVRKPYFCKEENFMLYCKNLDTQKLYTLQNFLSKADIKEFDIEKNGSIRAVIGLYR